MAIIPLRPVLPLEGPKVDSKSWMSANPGGLHCATSFGERRAAAGVYTGAGILCPLARGVAGRLSSAHAFTPDRTRTFGDPRLAALPPLAGPEPPQPRRLHLPGRQAAPHRRRPGRPTVGLRA